jgi:nucleoid-associated protein YgaU
MRKVCLILSLLLLLSLCGCGARSGAGLPGGKSGVSEPPPPPTPTPLLSPPPPTPSPDPAPEAGGASGDRRGEKRLPLGLQHAPEDVYPGLAAEAAARQSSYTVHPGDCLWTIAEACCGGGLAWRQLWEENRDTVPDPGLLYAGQELRLP